MPKPASVSLAMNAVLLTLNQSASSRLHGSSGSTTSPATAFYAVYRPSSALAPHSRTAQRTAAHVRAIVGSPRQKVLELLALSHRAAQVPCAREESPQVSCRLRLRNSTRTLARDASALKAAPARARSGSFGKENEARQKWVLFSFP